MIVEFSNSEETLNNILDLQYKNLRTNLSAEEIDSQGFVFVKHTYDSLAAICDAEPAVVAYDDKTLAGYALCMNKALRVKVPELSLMFESLENIIYDHHSLKDVSFIVCGQICISKPYRGKNLMRDLYHQMKKLNHKYQYCITEVSSQNKRSLHAHFKVGFKTIQTHLSETGEEWQIILWDWNQGQKINEII